MTTYRVKWRRRHSWALTDVPGLLVRLFVSGRKRPVFGEFVEYTDADFEAIAPPGCAKLLYNDLIDADEFEVERRDGDSWEPISLWRGDAPSLRRQQKVAGRKRRVDDPAAKKAWRDVLAHRKRFPRAKNSETARAVGISESTLRRYERDFGERPIS